MVVGVEKKKTWTGELPSFTQLPVGMYIRSVKATTCAMSPTAGEYEAFLAEPPPNLKEFHPEHVLDANCHERSKCRMHATLGKTQTFVAVTRCCRVIMGRRSYRSCSPHRIHTYMTGCFPFKESRPQIKEFLFPEAVSRANWPSCMRGFKAPDL